MIFLWVLLSMAHAFETLELQKMELVNLHLEEHYFVAITSDCSVCHRQVLELKACSDLKRKPLLLIDDKESKARKLLKHLATNFKAYLMTKEIKTALVHQGSTPAHYRGKNQVKVGFMKCQEIKSWP